MTRLVSCLIVIASLVSCAPPDRWGAFDVEWQRKLERMAAEPVAPREDLRPAWNSPLALDLPDTGELNLTIEQASVLALRNNRDLDVQQLNPIIAGTFEQIERGSFDPEVFGSGEYFEERANEIARSTGAQFSVEGRQMEGEAGIRQFLPTGTTVEATLGQERSISNRAPEQQIARMELTVTQSLLEGFGPAVNLVAVRQAELDTIASEYELRRFTEALLADTETAYWNHALAAKEIAIFESSLDVAKQQRDAVEQRIDVGVLPATEAAAARAEVALREQALIDARSALEATRIRLLRLINPDAAGALDRDVASVSDPRIEPEAITDLPDRLRVAERMRPDLNEARTQLERDRLETIVTRNGLLPRLDFFVSVGKTGFGDTFSESFNNINRNTYDFTAGLNFSQQLGNRTAEARHLAARATRQQAAAAVANLQQLVRMDVRLAANQVERARQQITATRATRELQQQTVDAERERFDVGSSTALLVAQAQRDLLQAQIAEVEAIVGYRVALVNLYYAEGSLLERRGVKLATANAP